MDDIPLCLGATREELRSLRGEPTDVSTPTRSLPHPAIWKYGPIEYHFGPDDRVWLVYTEDENHNPRVLGKWEGR